GLQALEIQLLHFVGRGFENHLKLVMLEEARRVFAEAAVRRTARRLDVRDVPVRRPEDPEKRLRVHGARADLDVERLLQRAAARSPKLGQLQNQSLERHDYGQPEDIRN